MEVDFRHAWCWHENSISLDISELIHDGFLYCVLFYCYSVERRKRINHALFLDHIFWIHLHIFIVYQAYFIIQNMESVCQPSHPWGCCPGEEGKLNHDDRILGGRLHGSTPGKRCGAPWHDWSFMTSSAETSTTFLALGMALRVPGCPVLVPMSHHI